MQSVDAEDMSFAWLAPSERATRAAPSGERRRLAPSGRMGVRPQKKLVGLVHFDAAPSCESGPGLRAARSVESKVFTASRTSAWPAKRKA